MRADARKRGKVSQLRPTKEDDYRLIFQLCPDMIAVANRQGILIDVNPACTRILGYEARELIGTSWEAFAHPEDIARTQMQVARQFQGSHIVNFTNRFRHKDGTYRTLQWQGAMTDTDCLLGTARDITEQTRRAELLASLAQKENKRLQAALHDGISQQLFGLQMLANQVHKSLLAENPETAQQAGFMEKVTQDTLLAVRGLMEGLAPCDNHTGTLADDIKRLVERTEQCYGIPCSLDSTHDCPLDIHPDVASQLCLIAQEAMVNAAKHAHPCHIAITLAADNSEISLMIRDDGTGMQTDREAHGGLGLTIMHERAALIGATLGIAPQHPAGTRVTCCWRR